MLVVIAAIGICGCQHIDVERRTLEQASTMTDMQYTQVLNNLAMISTNPGALPYYCAPGGGQTSVQRSQELDPSVGWDFLSAVGKPTHFILDKVGLAGKASRTANEQWTLTATLNPDFLRIMGCVYRKTIGISDPDCDALLKKFYSKTPEYLDAMNPSWFCRGRKSDVPHSACYVGHYCDCYVWVKPRGEYDLTLLTLAILDVATRKTPDATTGPKPATVETLRLLLEHATLLQSRMNMTTDNAVKTQAQTDLQAIDKQILSLLKEGTYGAEEGGELQPRQNLALPPGGSGILPVPQ